jgi:transposase
MASAVILRADYSASELRRLAATTRNANQSRRLLSLAAVVDGMNRAEAARIGGMDRQTLRDWVHRFNTHKGAHVVLLLDRAGWHTTPALAVPKNITMILLPSRAPELNPVENIWPYLRQNWLSPRVFDTYEDVVDAACDAWRKLIAQPDTITSIGSREWAITGQR